MPESTPNVLSLDGPDWQLYPLLPERWRWQQIWKGDPPGAAARRVSARVPGHVASALLAAGGMPHPFQGENSRLWEWTAERDWIYTRTFVVPEPWLGAEGAVGPRVWLRFEGIDGAAHVFLNGQPVGDHDASFVPAEWEVSRLLRPGQENRLCVAVERPPDVQGQIGWSSRERHWRARFAYGWDFAARLPPIGIWDSVTLRATGPVGFRNVGLHANVATDRTEASLSLVSEFHCSERTPAVVRWQVLREGQLVGQAADPITVFESDTSLVQSLRLRPVALWWPNGAGDQPLYEMTATIEARDGRPLDFRSFTFGVRGLEFVANEGAPPDSLPYTLLANGQRLFIKGSNWAPLDLLYGAAGREHYERLLTLARDAGINLLRVNGVGLLEKEVFYDLCDQFGILVWQEFPLSGSGIDSSPPADPAYLEQVRGLAAPMIARRRNHPSLALWCGGNELSGPNLTPLGSDEPALAAIKQVVETEDPGRAWLPTSPTGPAFMASPDRRGELHDVHGPWLYLGPDAHSRFYDAIDPLLHSEFGCESAGNLATLRWIAGEAGDAALWPPEPTNPLWMHHGGDWWLKPESVAELFGPLPDLATYVRASQHLQAEGIRYALEASRRRKWRCSGALPWQLNEPWPNAAGTSLVDYFGRPKSAYWALRRAYRPLHVSLSYPTLSWTAEGEFRADVWLHNSGAALALLNVAVTIAGLDGQVLYQESLAAEAPAGAAELAGDLRWRFPPAFAGIFVVCLDLVDEEGQRRASNAYLHSRSTAPIFAGLLAAPAAVLTAERGACLRLRNAGRAPAIGVEIEAPEDNAARIGDSWFVLMGGQTREIPLQAAGPVGVTAWNSAPVLVRNADDIMAASAGGNRGADA
jgi:beta-mannosidase